MLKVYPDFVAQSHIGAAPSATRTPNDCRPGKVLQESKSSLKANVYIATIDGQCVVVKDYSNAHPLLRATLCKWFIQREITALARLRLHPGVPDFIGSYGRFGFAMELIEGRTLDNEQLKNNALLLKQVDQTIKRMHHHGIGHNDIRNKNLILDREGKLYIVDFASAVIRSAHRFSLKNLLYRMSRFSDRIKLARLKQEFSRLSLTEQDRSMLKFVSSSKRISRLWKKHVYRIIKLGGG